MDGTQTDGRKGISYLRDHFLPALLAEAGESAPDGLTREAQLVALPSSTRRPWRHGPPRLTTLLEAAPPVRGQRPNIDTW